MRSTVSIRLSEKITKHLDDIAKEMKMSRSFHIQKHWKPILKILPIYELPLTA